MTRPSPKADECCSVLDDIGDAALGTERPLRVSSDGRGPCQGRIGINLHSVLPSCRCVSSDSGKVEGELSEADAERGN